MQHPQAIAASRPRFLLSLCVLLTIAATGCALATTYYVSSNGNDGYSGLRTSSAWQSIDNGDAKGLLQPGDIVLVAEGTYTPSTTDGVKLANCPGTASAPITYRANGAVLIDQSGFAGTSFGIRLMANMHHIAIDGFEITGCQFGVYFDGDGTSNWCYANTVRNCIIHDLHYADPAGGVWSSWCAGIYNSASRDNLIHNNIIYNVGTPGVDTWPNNTLWAACIMSPVCQGIEIYNNTFAGAWAGIHAWEPGSSTVRNNIFHDIWKFGLSNHQGSGSIANSHNLYFSSAAGYTDRVGDVSAGAGEASANPGFVGAAVHDYRLLPNSPAVNAGTNVGLLYEGSAPDIGAIESDYGPGDTIDVANIGDLRTVANGTPISLTSPKVVTAASATFADGSYYIEEPTRVCGIKVVPSGLPAVALSDRVTLDGIVTADSSGERVIIATALTGKTSGTAIGALGMRCREAQTPSGPETSGLLARIFGWVTSKASDGSFAYVDDGSAIKDATGNKGLRVLLSGLATPLTSPPAADQFASVTGIVGMHQDGTKLVRVLKPRSNGDMNYTSVSLTEEEAARRWVKANFGSDNHRRPFSFTYGGQNSSSVLANWTFTSSQVSLDANRKQRTLIYTDPATGLQLRCIATEYLDYPAVEWVLYFKNTGTANTPILANVQALDAEVYGGADSGTYKLYYAEGSHALVTDFKPKETTLTGLLSLNSFGGRSSDGYMPFFNLAKPDGSGVVVGLGWSGQWAASFNKNSAKTVRMQAGMEITNLKLLPGEEIRTPSVLMLFWSGGDRTRGNRQLRRILFDHFSPRPGGQPAIPPTAASAHGYVSFEGSTEANVIQGITSIYNHSLPVDTWWIDAGWFTLVNNNWAASVGNFDPDPARYPNGMKPVADAAHTRGYKFLLWFEPERVMPGTWMYNTHPDWLFSPPSDLPGEIMYMYNDHFHLLNLGNPDALAWLKNKISGMIGSVGIDIYRNDFNMYPSYYWRKGEATDRQGINEIRYVMGLYDFWDTLMRDHPNLLIDNCASGGRRIDLESLRRAVVLTPSDYLWNAIGQQCQVTGAAQWIPWAGVGGVGLDNYNFRSGMGTSYALAVNFLDPNPAIWTPATTLLNQYGSVKSLYNGDFYPLSAFSTESNVWMAWQFDRPETGEGIVQIFRRPDSTVNSMAYTLKALVPTANYKVSFADIPGYTTTRTGNQLMQSGLSFSLGAGGATYVTYKRQ